MANKIDEAVNKAKLQISEIEAAIKGVSNAINSISEDTLNKLNNFTKSKGSSGLRKELYEIKNSTERLTAAEEKARKQREALVNAQSRLRESLERQRQSEERLTNARNRANQKTSEAIVSQNALRRAADLEATANAKLLGAYARLNAQREIAKNKLRDLVASQTASNAQIDAARRKFQQLDAQVKKSNAAVSNFAKGGIGGLTLGLSNLLGAFGIATGVQLFADLARSAFNTAKKLDSLNFALKAVTGSSVKTLEAQTFLKDIADRYGASIITLTERYTKFIAAANESNLTIEESQGIFETFTKAAGVLGLKSDELNGIFLALEQMLSKNKVTTEELRRQLGERLPGAFNLMAKALGVSTNELDSMLRAGEVLASEALPKLRVEVERAFGSFEGDKIETLASGVERLSNAWTRFVEVILDGRSAAPVLDFFNVLITDFTDNIDNFNKSLSDQATIGEKIQLGFSGVVAQLTYGVVQPFKESNTELRKQIAEREAILQDQLEFARKQRAILSVLPQEQRAGILEQVNLRLQPKVSTEPTDVDAFRKSFLAQLEQLVGEALPETKTEKALPINATFNPFSDLKDTKRDVNFLEGRIKTLREEQKGLTSIKADLERSLQINEEIANLQEEIDKILNKQKNTGSGRRKDDSLVGSRSFLVDNISKLEKQRETLARNVDEWKKFTEQIDEAKRKLKDFDEAIELSELVGKSVKTIGSGQFNQKEFTERFERLFEIIKEGKEPIDALKPAIDKAREALDKAFEDNEDIKQKRRELEKLKKAIQELFLSFASNALSNQGFGSLAQFFDGSLAQIFKDIDTTAGEAADGKGFKKFAAAFQAVGEVAGDVFNFIDSAQRQQFENQLFRLEQEKEVALSFAGESADARRKIEEDFEQQRRQLLNQRAEQEKRNAIFQSLINTATGVTAALALGPKGIPLAIIIGALGIAQTAIIASTEVPKFEIGTDNAPEGIALVDEKRPEVHTDKRGRVKSFGKRGANFRYLEKGDKIYKSYDDFMERAVKPRMYEMGEFEGKNTEKTLTAKEIDAIMGKYFAKIQVVENNIDQNGFNTYIKDKSSKTKIANARATGKGFRV